MLKVSKQPANDLHEDSKLDVVRLLISLELPFQEVFP